MQLRDTDHDGIPDAFDCDPFDPTRDGFFGDVFRRVTSAARAAIHRAPIHPSQSRAAQRRAAVRRAVTPSIRRVTRTARSVIHRAPIHPSWERAARRRESVRREITRAARPVTSRIREVREYVALPATVRRERVAEGAKQFLATHQAQTRRMSDLSMRMHTATSRVARVIRGFERPVMERVSHVEESAGVRIPTPVKEFAAGVAFGAPATMVEMAGMVPGGVETLAKHPRVLPAAAAYGTYEMGRGMWKGITEHPIRTAGEFVGMGVIAKGVPETIGKIHETVRFRGKEYVPVESIAERELVAGKKEFPTLSSSIPAAERPEVALKMFRESPYKLPHETPGAAGWHATSAKFSKTAEAAVGARPETAPGLHLAPSASLHFLRLPKASSQLTFFDIPSLTRSHPGLLRVGVEAFERMPRQVREAGEAARVGYIYEQKGIPKAHISPAMEAGKTEIESIVAPGTQLVRRNFRYYTEVQGKKIPIYEYEALRGERFSKRGLSVAEVTRKHEKAMEEYYYRGARRPIIRPSSYAMPYHGSDYVTPPVEIRLPTPTSRRSAPSTLEIERNRMLYTADYGHSLASTQRTLTQRYRSSPPAERRYSSPSVVSQDHIVSPTGSKYKLPPTPTRSYRVPIPTTYAPSIPPVSTSRPITTRSHWIPTSIEKRYKRPPLADKESKRLLRKRRKHKPEYWQIRNPIANLQQMMFGRVERKNR